MNEAVSRELKLDIVSYIILALNSWIFITLSKSRHRKLSFKLLNQKGLPSAENHFKRSANVKSSLSV